MSLEQLQASLDPLRRQLLSHPIYEDLRSPQALRIFMQHHVFAVWDFMSLLKALQRGLCCVTVPWVPATPSIGARLVNEIVLAEETDDDGHGGYASHYELYRQSMLRFDVDTAQSDRFVELLRNGQSIESAMQRAELSDAMQYFVAHTFAIIDSGDLCRIASAFTFGRENLLPGVFQKIVEQLDRQTSGGLAEFNYYLKRHIDLDGDEHGPMALRLVGELCGNDANRWKVAQEAAMSSLQARLVFWDATRDAVLEASAV